MQQVSETDTFEHVVDLLLEEHPHGADAAEMRRRAAVGFNRMAHAVKVEGLELRRVDHAADRRLFGRLCQSISATRAARARDDPSPPQAEQDLLDIIARQLLERRDLPAGDGAVLRAPREMQRAYHAIFGPGRYSHA